MPLALFQLLDESAQAYPNSIAVEESGNQQITYKDLATLSVRLRNRLFRLGIRSGDRVGIYLNKSIDAVASIFGTLMAGAAYVPLDPGAPVSRNAYILKDCLVKAVVVEKCFAERIIKELASFNELVTFIIIEKGGGGRFLKEFLYDDFQERSNSSAIAAAPSSDSLAYILYTSGSTGKPKGVTLSNRNALSFLEWCSETFKPTDQDCFSSHAPFHFDLSILDLFLPIKHGSKLVLIEEELGRNPMHLAQLISEKKISNWYSTPSTLRLLVENGRMEMHEYSSLRQILFAGEVFPVRYLRALKNILPHPKYFNLYGPTETNVCTYYEIPAKIPNEQDRPFPIGKICSHLKAKVVDDQKRTVPLGREGELCIKGPSVMQGYWNLPEKSAAAFFVDEKKQEWYKTGDVVSEAADGNYIFIGRKDRMVKKRGYRIELGEIESCIYLHPAIQEAAVVAEEDKEIGTRIKASVSCKEGRQPSLIEMKRFCAERLPIYMVPDIFSFLEVLPKTSTGKIDYQRLKE
jgi:amino acid adenylation domain-containing protein